MQLVEADPALVGLGKPVDRSGHLRLNPLEFSGQRHARVDRDEQHHEDHDRAQHERLRGWAHELHDEEGDVKDCAAGVGDVMEAAQNRPEHGAGEHAAIGRIRGLQDAEGRGRDDEADDDHAAEPDDERGQGHVPDCEHPVIIIAKPAAAGACMTRPTAAAPITDILLQADARGEPLGPAGVTFLVRRYAATGADEIRDVLERGLTTALDRAEAGGRWDVDWVHALCEAAAVADDERIADAAAAAALSLRDEWPCRDGIADAARSVDACLTAAVFAGDRLSGRIEGQARDLIAASVDELERVICIAYHPGEMLPRSLRSPDEADGGVVEHVAAATALLTAYGLTTRLPYSMLAEELIQPTQLHEAECGIATRCALARALCRLARLHDDDEYRRAAVMANARDYRAEAAALLDGMTAAQLDSSENAAIVGVALDELARAS